MVWFISSGTRWLFFPGPFNNIGSACWGNPFKPWAYNYSTQISGLKFQKELPSFKEALSRFEELGLDTTFFKESSGNPPNSCYYDKSDLLYPYNIYHKTLQHTNFSTRCKKILGIYYQTYLHPLWIFHIIRNILKPYTMSYPLVRGFSDIFIIPANQIKIFAKYCGIFAAANLFVEISIPTAMILLRCQIINGNASSFSTFEENISHNHTKVFEGDSILPQFKFGYNQLLDNLLTDFHSSNILGLHPIKLSQWDTDLSEDTLKLLRY